MATHAPITGASTRAPAIILNRARREAIENEIELHLQRVTILIARLDRADGDCDLEDDDPAGDTLDEHGEMPSDDGQRIAPLRPAYAVDQTAGPTNAKVAFQAHQAAELGLVHSSTGGWRWVS